MENEENGQNKDEFAPTPLSSSSWRENIKKRYPGLKIVDDTEEMIGKTSLFTMVRPPQKKNE